MHKFKTAIAGILALFVASAAVAQTFPTVPDNTVIGRLGVGGSSGPSQAIPFATLATRLAGSTPNAIFSTNNSSVSALRNIITGQTYGSAMTGGVSDFGYSFRNSTTTASDIYNQIDPTQIFSDSVQSVFRIPTTSTQQHVGGLSSYIRNDSGATNGVGFFHAGMGTVQDARNWGINLLLQDNATRTTHSRTGQILVNELDFNVMGANTQVIGLSLGGNGLAQSTNAIGFVVNSLSGASAGTYRWQTGFMCFGATVVNECISIGAQQASGTSIDSQKINFQYLDAAAAIKIGTMTAGPGTTGGGAFTLRTDGPESALQIGNSPSEGRLIIAGSTSGVTFVDVQAAASGFLKLPNATGTLVATASAPLAINSTTGNLTVTGVAGQVLAGATPAFTATPTLGVAGASIGTLALAGNTSGTVTITPQAAAGTATFTLPNASGTPAISVPSPLSLSATTGAVSWSGLTSGGVLYASSTTAVASSGALTSTAIVLGGGAGVAPNSSGCTIDSSNSISCSSSTSFSPTHSLTNTSNDAGSAGFNFTKSRAGGSVAASDNLGAFTFFGVQNSGTRFASSFNSKVDGSPSGNFVPSVWNFTTGDTVASLSQTMSFNAQGRLSIATRTAPTVGTCGTSPTVTSGSTDVAGEVTAGTATPTACTITFTSVSAYAVAPKCVVNSNPQVAAFSYSVSQTAITVTQTATSSNKISWHCIGA